MIAIYGQSIQPRKTALSHFLSQSRYIRGKAEPSRGEKWWLLKLTWESEFGENFVAVDWCSLHKAFTSRGPCCWHYRERPGTCTCADYPLTSWVVCARWQLNHIHDAAWSLHYACKGYWGLQTDKRLSLFLADNQAPFGNNALFTDGKS